MAPGRTLEALWPDQSQDEIGAKGEGDGETKRGFNHGALSQSAEAANIERDKRDHGEAKCEKEQVGHCQPPLRFRQ